ncbi:cell division cycle protein 20 homolog [Styela clava]
MTSQYDFENEVNSLLRLDAPIKSGPMPRWQRKNLNVPGCNSSGNTSIPLSPLKISNHSLSKSIINSPSSFLTPSSAKCKTPRAKSKTPTRGLSLNKTPSRGDRYIPNRQATNFELGQYKLTSENDIPSNHADTSISEEYKKLLKENLKQLHQSSANEDKIFAFKDKPMHAEGYQNSSKVLYSSTKKNPTSRKKNRYIPSTSEQVLDAPQLLDDYYLNLIDWSSTNILAVALGESVYLFNTNTGDIQLLLTMNNPEDYICSLSWATDGRHIAVGTSNAEVQLWDVTATKRLRNMTGHAARVGSLAWNEAILASGSRDGFIHFHDVRIANHLVHSNQGHAQEVCGLEWSPDQKYLASGGNDNMVNVWDERAIQPLYSFSEHQSAVKAIAWCPWQSHILASGGGSADRHIRFWNSYTGSMINAIDTKSQVCALKWSSNYKELVSSHGYSQNQITIWSYPSMRRVQDLLGHKERVLYLAMSPDETTVCSGAADESLRMWKCFAPEEKSNKKSVLEPSSTKGSSRVAACMSIR